MSSCFFVLFCFAFSVLWIEPSLAHGKLVDRDSSQHCIPAACSAPKAIRSLPLSSRQSSVLVDISKETRNQRRRHFRDPSATGIYSQVYGLEAQTSFLGHPGKDEHSINKLPMCAWLAQLEGDGEALCGQLEAGSKREFGEGTKLGLVHTQP